MFYLDTSSLLKLLLEEPESEVVRNAVAAENKVLVSALAELEAEVQLKAGWLAGKYSRSRWHRYEKGLQHFRQLEPFEFRSLAGTLFQTALAQHRKNEHLHGRTLDRLHLAAMAELSVNRLMTHDDAQAKAAQVLGYEVLSPR